MSLPYMQLFPSDYMGDTRHLSTEQHGAYLLMLMAMWNAGGSLPNVDDKLARITGLTRAKWLKHRPDIIAFFRQEDGVLRHNRIDRDLNAARELSKTRSEIGKKGADARWGRDLNANESEKPRKNSYLFCANHADNPLGNNEAAMAAGMPTQHQIPSLSPDEAAIAASRRTNPPDSAVLNLRKAMAAAWKSSGMLRRCPDTSRAAVWLAKGYRQEVIIAVIEEVLRRKPDVAAWSYFDGPLADAHTPAGGNGGRHAPTRKPSLADLARADVERAALEDEPPLLRFASG
jgi:uncharacterized protein YdaU (DUF1376 family)